MLMYNVKKKIRLITNGNTLFDMMTFNSAYKWSWFGDIDTLVRNKTIGTFHPHVFLMELSLIQRRHISRPWAIGFMDGVPCLYN